MLGLAAEPLLRNDTFAVMRAGASRGWGVAVVCGAGFNCTGVGPDGRESELVEGVPFVATPVFAATGD